MSETLPARDRAAALLTVAYSKVRPVSLGGGPNMAKHVSGVEEIELAWHAPRQLAAGIHWIELERIKRQERRARLTDRKNPHHQPEDRFDLRVIAADTAVWRQFLLEPEYAGKKPVERVPAVARRIGETLIVAELRDFDPGKATFDALAEPLPGDPNGDTALLQATGIATYLGGSSAAVALGAMNPKNNCFRPLTADAYLQPQALPVSTFEFSIYGNTAMV